MRKLIAVAVVALLAVLATVAGCGAPSQPVSAPPAVDPASRQQAPDFNGTTLSGQSFSLAGVRGKPAVVSFWGSW